MSLLKQHSRISHHTLTNSGSDFSIPASEDFTDGSWTETDLALSEFGINEGSGEVYIRVGEEVKKVLTGTDGGVSIGDGLVFVSSIDDLPPASGSVITLEASTAYYFLTDLDLSGSRLEGSNNTCLLGPSSENAFITSTGLGVGVPLFRTEWTTPIRHITFRDVDYGFEITGSVNPPVALDWTGVNFDKIPNVGTIDTCDNFIYDKGAFLGAQGLVFSGSIGTIALNNSLLQGAGSAGAIVSVASGSSITRRFRTIYSSIIAFGSTEAIDFHPSASIPAECFILDTVNFAGGSTYLSGIDETSNKSLFANCKGIMNTSVNGQLYIRNNTTATPISATGSFYKVEGATTASADNANYSHSDNRLTCDAEIERKYLIQASLSYASANQNQCEFGFYDSKLGAVREPSITLSKANAAGRAENITFMCVVQHGEGDYLEIHCANLTDVNDITVENLNFVITEIK